MAKCFQSSCTDEQDSLDNIWIASNSKLSKLHGQCNTGSVNPHCFNYSIKNAFLFFFFSALPHCGSRTELSPYATLILQMVTFMSSSPQPPPWRRWSQWGYLCQEASRGWGPHPHCARQGDRRKAVLNSAAAWFSFVIFLTFNNFQCFVRNKSPCRGFHGLPGIRTCCSHVTPICHCTYIRMRFVCSVLFVLLDWLSHYEVSKFHLPRKYMRAQWAPRALPQLLTRPLPILCAAIAYIYLSDGGKARRRHEMPGSITKVSEDTKSSGADWLLGYIAK